MLSFDDGYPGDVDVALPMFHAHGWSGVLNLQIDNIVPARVRLLIAAGWESTRTRSRIPTSRMSALRSSPKRSPRPEPGSANVFHVPANFFCYPSGRYDSTVVAAVRRAGYLGATTTNEGFASPDNGLFTLNRVRVNGSDGIAGLARKVQSG